MTSMPNISTHRSSPKALNVSSTQSVFNRQSSHTPAESTTITSVSFFADITTDDGGTSDGAPTTAVTLLPAKSLGSGHIAPNSTTVSISPSTTVSVTVETPFSYSPFSSSSTVISPLHSSPTADRRGPAVTANNLQVSSNSFPSGITHDCGTPPVVPGGTVTSSGPYKTGTSAVYACISGYTLTGTATILCDTNYQWSGTPPQCLGPNSVRLAASDTGLEKELTGMPVWLAIIVGVTVGVLCLLLLTCLLILCLRIFGCWKRSFFDDSTKRSTRVYPEKQTVGDTRATTTVLINEKSHGDNKDLKGNASTVTTTGIKTYDAKAGKDNFRSPPRINVTYDAPHTRRLAKIPEGRKWMPHSHGVRNFNTSTK